MKAVIYSRVSTSEQSSNGVSLDNQVEKCRLQAQLNDYTVVSEYQDAGVSAKTLNRDGIKAVIELVEKKRIQAVIIFKLDRLTRNVSDLNRLIEMLNKKGVELISVKDSLNTSTASGRMVINLLGTISQWERETVAERTKEALQYKKANNQKFTGICPYGLTLVDGNRYIENPEEQRIIEKIAELRDISKLSWQKIADSLNNDKVPTRKGGLWIKQTVCKIFKDHQEKIDSYRQVA